MLDYADCVAPTRQHELGHTRQESGICMSVTLIPACVEIVMAVVGVKDEVRVW